jgi:hypothetical protein
LKTGKIIFIGCIVLSVLALIAFIGGGAAIYHFAQSPAPSGMSVQIESPEKVKKGEQFQMRIIVVNERKNKPLKVSSIDIGSGFLYGVTVKSSEPRFRSSSQIPMDGGRTYDFDRTIPPGETNIFVFNLRAKNVGNFSGDVDVCEGMRFLTMVAETEVVGKDDEIDSETEPGVR